MCHQKENNAANVKLALGIFSVSIVLGLAWIFGVLIVNDAAIVFRYFFVICNTFQGFVFFLFIVLVGTEGRAFWTNSINRNVKKVMSSRTEIKLTSLYSPQNGTQMFWSQSQNKQRESNLSENDKDVI